MECTDPQMPIDSLLLYVVKEILQVILIEEHLHEKAYPSLSNGATCELNGGLSAQKISISLQLKHKNEENRQIFCLKVKCGQPVPYIPLMKEGCLPWLCQLVCKMQELEQESHLAVQCSDLSTSSQAIQVKKSVLWFDIETRIQGKPVPLVTQHEAVKESSGSDDVGSVLQVRIFRNLEKVICEGKSILDLLHWTKLLKPHVQMTFFMDTGNKAEVELSSTESLSYKSFHLFTGLGLFLGHSHFTSGELQVTNSIAKDIQCTNGSAMFPSIQLTCLLCCLPLKHPECEQKDMIAKKYIPGKISIQAYGLHGLPLDMEEFCSRLSVKPDSFLPWNVFGLKVKLSQGFSPYDLHCTARLAQSKTLPAWASGCHRFHVALMFVLVQNETLSVDSVKQHQEMSEVAVQNLLDSFNLRTLRETSMECMQAMFGSEEHLSSQHAYPQEPEPKDEFEAMIPDIASTVTEMFVRSTNADFRAQVRQLMPTETRTAMKNHLELKLWQVLKRPREVLLVPASQDTGCQEKPVVTASQVVPENVEDRLLASGSQQWADTWEMSQDSLLDTARTHNSMSPDSLDLDITWEDISQAEDSSEEVDVNLGVDVSQKDERTSQDAENLGDDSDGWDVDEWKNGSHEDDLAEKQFHGQGGEKVWEGNDPRETLLPLEVKEAKNSFKKLSLQEDSLSSTSGGIQLESKLNHGCKEYICPTYVAGSRISALLGEELIHNSLIPENLVSTNHAPRRLQHSEEFQGGGCLNVGHDFSVSSKCSSKLNPGRNDSYGDVQEELKQFHFGVPIASDCSHLLQNSQTTLSHPGYGSNGGIERKGIDEFSLKSNKSAIFSTDFSSYTSHTNTREQKDDILSHDSAKLGLTTSSASHYEIPGEDNRELSSSTRNSKCQKDLQSGDATGNCETQPTTSLIMGASQGIARKRSSELMEEVAYTEEVKSSSTVDSSATVDKRQKLGDGWELEKESSDYSDPWFDEVDVQNWCAELEN